MQLILLDLIFLDIVFLIEFVIPKLTLNRPFVPNVYFTDGIFLQPQENQDNHWQPH